MKTDKLDWIEPPLKLNKTNFERLGFSIYGVNDNWFTDGWIFIDKSDGMTFVSKTPLKIPNDNDFVRLGSKMNDTQDVQILCFALTGKERKLKPLK